MQRGIVYGQGEVDGGGSFADLKLDLYTPQGTGQTRFPLVVDSRNALKGLRSPNVFPL